MNALKKDLVELNAIATKSEVKWLNLSEPYPIGEKFLNKLNDDCALLDFSGIRNLEELNLKLGRDLTIVKSVVRNQKLQLVYKWPKLVELFYYLEHSSIHDDKIIHNYGKIYSTLSEMASRKYRKRGSCWF